MLLLPRGNAHVVTGTGPGHSSPVCLRVPSCWVNFWPSVADPWHLGVDMDPDAADPCLWLMDPDSDPAIFVIDLQDRCQQKNNLKNNIFLLLTFWRYRTFTSFFKDKKSKRGHKTVGIKVFLTIFAWWWKDPDPGSPKTYGSDGSGFGSAKLLYSFYNLLTSQKQWWDEDPDWVGSVSGSGSHEGEKKINWRNFTFSGGLEAFRTSFIRIKEMLFFTFFQLCCIFRFWSSENIGSWFGFIFTKMRVA